MPYFRVFQVIPATEENGNDLGAVGCFLLSTPPLRHLTIAIGVAIAVVVVGGLDHG